MNNSNVALFQSCVFLLTCLDFNPTVSDLDVLSWSWGMVLVFCVFFDLSISLYYQTSLVCFSGNISELLFLNFVSYFCNSPF